MPLFNYDAIDSKGKKRSGTIEADNEPAAKELLRKQGTMVAMISSKGKVSSRQNFNTEQLATFTMQLSQLVDAGVPLYEALLVIEEQSRCHSYHRIVLSLCEQVKSGTPLSEAMGHYPQSFDRLYCTMAYAGESAGALALVLDKLSLFLIKRNKLKKQLATALIYPAILASFSLLLILLLLTFVVPSIEGLFVGRELNSITYGVIAVSHFFQHYWWLYIPLVAGSITYLFIKGRTPKGRLWLQRRLLAIPVVRNLIIEAAVARFCRTMGTLQLGGVAMIDSLRIARRVINNATIEADIANAEARVIEGSSLSAELLKSEWIPPMASRMIAVGEEAGALTTMFNKIADLYEDEVEKTLDRVMGLAQPVILVVMGSIIGIILLAILLPLTDVNSFTM